MGHCDNGWRDAPPVQELVYYLHALVLRVLPRRVEQGTLWDGAMQWNGRTDVRVFVCVRVVCVASRTVSAV